MKRGELAFPSRPFLTRAAPVVLALSLALSFRAPGADPSREYRKGLQAFRASDFSEAVRAFRASISADPGEGVQKLRGTGVSFDDYFPHLYLGLSLEKLGQASEAMAALLESERQGAVFERPELRRQLQASLSRMKSAAAEAQARAVPPTQPPPTQPPPPPPTATPLPVRLAIPTAATLEPAKSAPTPPRPVLVAQKASPAPRQALPSPARTAAASPAQPREASLSALRQGVGSYFEGRFDEAVAQLRPLAASQPMAQLFLSYSLASQALLKKTPDSGLAGEARAQYRESVTRGARLKERDLISPRVLRLVEE